MSATHADQLVHEYLSRLASALQGVPPSRRDEILEEISNHIADERDQLHDNSDAAVLNLLDRIGEPAEVAAAARDDAVSSPQPTRHIGPVEVLAVVLTPMIWPVGVILLWLSPAWNTRDKLIGTLVPPGGYLFVLFLPDLLIANLGVSGGCMTVSDAQGRVLEHSCTGVDALPVWQQDLMQAAGIGLFLLVLVLPVLTAIYLARRARKWSAESQT